MVLGNLVNYFSERQYNSTMSVVQSRCFNFFRSGLLLRKGVVVIITTIGKIKKNSPNLKLNVYILSSSEYFIRRLILLKGTMSHICYLKCIFCLQKNVGKAGFKLDPPASVSWVWGLLVYATSSLIFRSINKHFNSCYCQGHLCGISPTFSAKLDVLLVCPGLGLCILLHSVHPNSGRGGFLLTSFYISVSPNDHTPWIY